MPFDVWWDVLPQWAKIYWITFLVLFLIGYIGAFLYVDRENGDSFYPGWPSDRTIDICMSCGLISILMLITAMIF